MPSTASHGPASPAHAGPARRTGRVAWVAWWTGWILLAAVSMIVAYGALVIVGR
jgi:hypothetical protein